MTQKCLSNASAISVWERDRRNDLACDLTTSCARIRSRTLNFFFIFVWHFSKRGYISYNVKERDFTGVDDFEKKKNGGGKSRRTHRLNVLRPPEKRVSLRPILVFFVRSFVRELEMNLIKRNNNCAHKFSLQAERETRKMEEKTLKLVGEGEKKHTHQHQSWMQIKTHRVLLFLSFFSLIKIQ